MDGYSYPYKICDPVHGFIRFDAVEKELIDSKPFQRLRYLHQLGMTYLLYPGATHTRFEHSLGVMELVSRAYDSFMQNESVAGDERFYWRRILRLAALCHDLGHLPFSHTAEKSLLPQGGHERMTLTIIRSPLLQPLWKTVGPSAEEDIIKLCIAEKEHGALGLDLPLTPWQRVLSQAITDDNFGADRVDYLIRDATYTGVGYGHFDYHQLIDTLRILPALNNPQKLALGVVESGIQAIESLWIARYLMYARVYHHPRTRVLSHHMCRFIAAIYEKEGFPSTVEGYLDQTDYRILGALSHAAKRGDYDAGVLLKEEEEYREIPHGTLSDGILSKLEREFQEDIFIDRLHFKQGENFRLFAVEREGKVIPSVEASSFLRDIPLGTKTLRLYAKPSVVPFVKKCLADLA